MNGCLGIFFPVPESCDFSTKTCRDKCIAKIQQLTQTLTKEQRGLLSPETRNLLSKCPATKHYPSKQEQMDCFEAFKERSVETLVLWLLSELLDTDERIIHWFASGDCPKPLVNKVAGVIASLETFGYVSCGFTRNSAFQDAVDKLYGISRIARTVENVPKNITCSRDAEGPEGLIAEPNYSTGQVRLYYGREDAGFCGWGSYTKENISHRDGCKECLIEKCGCFFKVVISNEHPRLKKLKKWIQEQKQKKGVDDGDAAR